MGRSLHRCIAALAFWAMVAVAGLPTVGRLAIAPAKGMAHHGAAMGDDAHCNRPEGDTTPADADPDCHYCTLVTTPSATQHGWQAPATPNGPLAATAPQALRRMHRGHGLGARGPPVAA